MPTGNYCSNEQDTYSLKRETHDLLKGKKIFPKRLVSINGYSVYMYG